jgi:hypothetical protein
VLFMILYGFLVIKARCVDCHEKKKTGHIFLQKDTPPYHQLYAIVIDTGFRSPAHFTSKVTQGSWGGLLWGLRVWTDLTGTRSDNVMHWCSCQSLVPTGPILISGLQLVHPSHCPPWPAHMSGQNCSACPPPVGVPFSLPVFTDGKQPTSTGFVSETLRTKLCSFELTLYSLPSHTEVDLGRKE